MLEKIDNFINKFFNWKIFKNILLAELFCIPHALIVRKFHISMTAMFILDFSFLLSTICFKKVLKEFEKGVGQ